MLPAGNIFETYVNLFSSRSPLFFSPFVQHIIPEFIVVTEYDGPADGIVINMVVGGEVVALKGLEESSGLIIAEMPINVS